jgi:hypothetical protein
MLRRLVRAVLVFAIGLATLWPAAPSGATGTGGGVLTGQAPVTDTMRFNVTFPDLQYHGAFLLGGATFVGTVELQGLIAQLFYSACNPAGPNPKCIPGVGSLFLPGTGGFITNRASFSAVDNLGASLAGSCGTSGQAGDINLGLTLGCTGSLNGGASVAFVLSAPLVVVAGGSLAGPFTSG